MTKEELISKLNDIEWEDFEIKKAEVEAENTLIASDEITSSMVGNENGGQIGGQIGGQKKDYLTTRQKEVLKIISDNPEITRKELAVKLGNISESAVQKHIEALKKKQSIVRIGSDAKGYWKINH